MRRPRVGGESTMRGAAAGHRHTSSVRCPGGLSRRTVLCCLTLTLMTEMPVRPPLDTHQGRSPGAGTKTLRWQAGDKPRRELQDDGSIDACRVAVPIHVAGLLTEQERDDSGSKLQDQGSIDAADIAIAVDIA